MRSQRIILIIFIVINTSYLHSDNSTAGSDIHSNINFDELTKIVQTENQVNSLIISKDRKIIYTYERTPGYIHTLQDYYSCTKSITALLIGIAIDEGYISDENAFIEKYFANNSIPNFKDSKIRIKDLLSMTSGIDWPESTTWNHLFRPMVQSDNWIEFIQQRPIVEKPGIQFNYSTGDYHLLSKIIKDSTGKNLDQYAQDVLFTKINIEEVEWFSDPQGYCFGGSGIRLRPIDAIKIGYLILDSGMYNNRRIVSADWINKISTKQNNGEYWGDAIGGAYSFGWWINSYSNHYTVFAWGAREQYIFVTPDLNTVVVFNSDYRNINSSRPPILFKDLIINYLE